MVSHKSPMVSRQGPAGCTADTCLVGSIGRKLVLSAGQPASELQVGLLSVMECEALLEGRLQQHACLAHWEMEPYALFMLPLPHLSST